MIDFFFCWWPNPRPCIFYALSISIELRSRGHPFLLITRGKWSKSSTIVIIIIKSGYKFIGI